MTDDRIEGSFIKLSADSLTILTADGVEREYSKTNIERITSANRRQDSLVNGAAIGTAIGGISAALVVAAVMGQADGMNANIFLGIPVAAGVGAGIGLAGDAIKKDHEILYEAPQNSPES